MISLLLSVFLAQTQPAEAPAQASVPLVLPDVTYKVQVPGPDVTIMLGMQQLDLDAELKLNASFVGKIPESID
ncbi:MAG: hypothetical protein ACI9VR_004381 [Cognaticolwellia sp.]|jgi:hypothetical protein